MEMPVVMIASTLPLALLLLWALFENVSVDRTHSVRATAPRQRDEAEGRRFPEPRVEDLNWRLQRSDWVALPGRVAVARVPRRMQADALEILSSLDVLNIYFADTEHDPGLDGH
jgi:hypothetical protein